MRFQFRCGLCMYDSTPKTSETIQHTIRSCRNLPGVWKTRPTWILFDMNPSVCKDSWDVGVCIWVSFATRLLKPVTPNLKGSPFLLRHDSRCWWVETCWNIWKKGWFHYRFYDCLATISRGWPRRKKIRILRSSANGRCCQLGAAAKVAVECVRSAGANPWKKCCTKLFCSVLSKISRWVLQLSLLSWAYNSISHLWKGLSLKWTDLEQQATNLNLISNWSCKKGPLVHLFFRNSWMINAKQTHSRAKLQEPTSIDAKESDAQ